jgi:uncharacterized FAD-dependent dehydrogenase
MREDINGKVEVSVRTEVEGILVKKTGEVAGVRLKDGRQVKARVVIAAPGREGSEWMTGEAGELGINLVNNAVDIGLRVEVPAIVMEPLTDALY